MGAYQEVKKTDSVAHKFIFRVTALEGSTARVLWEGDSIGAGTAEAEKFAEEARAAGSSETIVLDSFKLDLERRWVHRLLTSRPPSVTPIRTIGGKRNRPRILFLPLELPTWNNGAHSWSYAASLAYEEGLRRAGCEVTTINSACAPYHAKLLRGRRFDQVWLHCHPRNIADFSFRQWVSEIAPVRLMLVGETVHYDESILAAEPWSATQQSNFEKWAPHVTHAAFVDPADLDRSTIRRSMWWQQAVPEKFVRPVNPRPSVDAGIFVGTLYPPRDRWVFELGALLEKVESPESDAFRYLFDKSHEWIQGAFDRSPTSPWWTRHAHRLYNRAQSALRRHAFRNFLDVLSQGVAVVNLPSMVQTYSGRVVEGMAAGRPVVTRRLAGHAPIFADGEEILHYGDAEELGEHLRTLKARPAIATAIAQNARRAILAAHTVEHRTAELLRFVEGDASRETSRDISPYDAERRFQKAIADE